MANTLPRPAAATNEYFTSNVSAFVLIHLLALLALIPYLFSWTGVALVFLGNLVFGGLGINIGYHRLLVHRGFKCSRWLEHAFALLGVCCFQDSPIRWIVIHRLHHQHTDEQEDPHSPSVSYFWGHIGWLIYKNRNLRKKSTLQRYAGDLMRDPFYLWLDRHRAWIFVYLGHAVGFLLLGILGGWLSTGTLVGAVQFGLSVLVWGVFVRTVYVWHVTWSANAACHLWGYRNYRTRDHSTNNWIVSVVTAGEGWHNNHHALPRCASHGHKWWEVDLMYSFILFLGRLGLVTDVIHPDARSERTSRRIGRMPVFTMKRPLPMDSALATESEPTTPTARTSVDPPRPDVHEGRDLATSPRQNFRAFGRGD